MTQEDLKVGILNVVTLMLSFSDIEQILQIGLLVVSIAYTTMQLLKIFKERKKWL
jgi:hypothetical protein